MAADHAEAARELARRDPAMRRMVEMVGPPDVRRGRRRGSHFAELTRIVCSQQLAGSAARAIHARFCALFTGPPTAGAVLALPPESLRAAGLSGAKAAAIRDLAAHVASGDLTFRGMDTRDDTEIAASLLRVRGIGQWSVDMYLLFSLQRPDVWPAGDLGVRKGYARLYGLDAPPEPAVLLEAGDRFRPYRSTAAWYCWRALDGDAVPPVTT